MILNCGPNSSRNEKQDCSRLTQVYRPTLTQKIVGPESVKIEELRGDRIVGLGYFNELESFGYEIQVLIMRTWFGDTESRENEGIGGCRQESRNQGLGDT